MTRFILDAVTLQFSRDPSRHTKRAVRFQIRERDSLGGAYLYNKSIIKRTIHGLEFSGVSGASLDALLAFQKNTARGTKRTFSWYDQAETLRTVRFSAARIEYQQAGSDKFLVSFSLQEDN